MKTQHNWHLDAEGVEVAKGQGEGVPDSPEQAQHSPLPWAHNATQPFTRYDGVREEGFAAAIWGPNDEPICSLNFSVGKWKALPPEVQDANAKLIVASVNHADKLAEALRELLRVDTLPIQFATNSQRIRLKRRALEECRAALANWEAAQS